MGVTMISMHRWRRPYPLGSLVWARVASTPLVVLSAAWVWVDLVRHESVWMLAVVGPVWLYAVGFAVRSSMLGVYVSDEGVMSRTLTGTRRVEWRSVAGIGSRGPGRQSIYLDLVGGESVRTAIVLRHLSDTRYSKERFGRVRYWPDPFDEIVAILRAELAARRPAPLPSDQPRAER